LVYEKVRYLLADRLDVREEVVTEDTDMVNDLGADSLDVIDLLTLLEDEYSIMISDESVKKLRRVGDIVKYIEAQI
jgi:acyl carrier protein